MRQRVAEEPERPVQRIYNDVLTQAIAADPGAADSLAASVPTFHSIRSTLYRERRKNTPPLPKNRSEIHLPDDFKTTVDGRVFLQADSGQDDKILVFATDAALERLCASQTVYMDGTFYTCPRLFHQLFTFHVEAYGKMFPLMFAFLPDKSQATYQRLFQIVKERAQAHGLEFSPSRIQTDYEQAIIVAVRQEFPGTRISGCLFHFGQALWRKIQGLGGAAEYQNSAESRQYLRRCSALAFVPLQKLDDAWVDLQADAPDSPMCRAFADYFVQTWMDDIASRFPRTMWNHFDNMTEHSVRTNNSLESWHRWLKGMVTTSHPHIFKMLITLRKEQERIEAELRMLRLGQNTRRPRKTAVRRVAQRLERVHAEYLSGQRTLTELLDATSYAVHF